MWCDSSIYDHSHWQHRHMQKYMQCVVNVCDNSHRQCIHTYANDRSQAMGGTQALSRRSETPGVSSLPKGAGMPGTPSAQQSQPHIHARVGLRGVGRCPGGCSFRCSQSGHYRRRPSRTGGREEKEAFNMHRRVQQRRNLSEWCFRECYMVVDRATMWQS